MVDPRKLWPRKVIRGMFWPRLFPQINFSGSICLGAAIQSHARCRHSKQGCWMCILMDTFSVLKMLQKTLLWFWGLVLDKSGTRLGFVKISSTLSVVHNSDQDCSSSIGGLWTAIMFSSDDGSKAKRPQVINLRVKSGPKSPLHRGP